MSLLSMSIDQIQRPTFWGSFDSAKYSLSPRQLQAEQRRKDLLESIRKNGGRVSISKIRADFEWTTATIRNITSIMVKNGILHRAQINGETVYELM